MQIIKGKPEQAPEENNLLLEEEGSLSFQKEGSAQIGKKFSVQALTRMSLCAALLCVSAFISIPLPFTTIPFTAQTIAIVLTGLLLTPKQAAGAVGVYLMMGACGLPVFSGGAGGLGKLFGPTGGFIFGFLLIAPLIAWLKGNRNQFWRLAVVSILIGLPLLYLCGALWMMFSLKISFPAALASGVLPFIPLDLLKCLLAALIAKTLNQTILRDSPLKS